MKQTLPKRGLKKTALIEGYSMDEIDRASFQAGPAPWKGKVVEVKLRKSASVVPRPPAPASAKVAAGMPGTLSLDGEWQLAEGGDARARVRSDWNDAITAWVPGSVHAALEAAGRLPDQTVGRNQEIAREESYKTWWMKKTFPRPEGDAPFLLRFDGVCNRCSVYLNGRKLGGHEGMFGGPDFDVTERLRDQNTLVVKLEPIPFRHLDRRPHPPANESWADTVVFNCVYGWHYSCLPSLGIWRGVRVDSTPAVSMIDPFVSTRDTKGTVELVLGLQGNHRAADGHLHGILAPENFQGDAVTFSVPVETRARHRKLRLRFRVPDPHLWWPNDMGKPNLYRMTLTFTPEGAGVTDVTTFTFGLRTIGMAPLPEGKRPDKYEWTFVINGRPMFAKGTGWCTMDPLMDFRRERYDRFLSMARDEHCQMVRAWGGGMPETDDFYDLCDRYGLMVMQEWPTAGNSHETQPYDVLEETVVRNTLRLRNRASLVMWGAGNESKHPFGRAIDMMGRLSIELDGTRPFHRGQPRGGSQHGYPTYWGRQHPDAHLIREADFFGEFGNASLPVVESVRRYLPDDEKDLWPAPEDGSFAYHTPIFNDRDDMDRQRQFARYFAPADADMQTFIVATQLTQVVVLRHQLERARVRWPDCTGALLYKLNDNFPAASWATVDWYGAPKIAHYFVQDAFAPVHACVLFDSVRNVGTPMNLPVYLLDDAGELEGKAWSVTVRVYNGQLQEIRSETFRGQGAVGKPAQLGTLPLSFEETDTVPLLVVAEVKRGRTLVDRTFYFSNYEHQRGCMFALPETTLELKVKGKRATVTNTGKLPAVGVQVERPGHADTFTVSDGFVWIDAGERVMFTVSETEDLNVTALNAGDGHHTAITPKKEQHAE